MNTIVDCYSKTGEDAIKSASNRYGGKWEFEFAEDTRTNFLHKLFKDGGTHWPDRWIVRRVGNV